jgi:hypothetical protein
MLSFSVPEWAKFLSTGAVGTALGGVLTAVGKGFWVRWIEERTLPTQELLVRLENGKLTAYGRRRLEGEGHEMLACWRRALPVPIEGQKLPTWPSGTST